MHKKFNLFPRDQKPTIQVEIALEGIFDFLSKSVKQKEPEKRLDLKESFNQTLNKTYSNLTWVEDHLKVNQTVSHDLVKYFTLKGKVIKTPLEALKEGFKIEEIFINKYKQQIIELNNKACLIKDKLEENLTNPEKNSSAIEVDKMLNQIAKDCNSLKLVFSNSFSGPEWFGGEKLLYSDISLEAVSESSLQEITANDIVEASKYIEQYWTKLNQHKDFLYELNSPLLDYHIYKWVGNIDEALAENNSNLDIIFNMLGEYGECDKQLRFFEKQLEKMEELIGNVAKWFYEVTNK